MKAPKANEDARPVLKATVQVPSTGELKEFYSYDYRADLLLQRIGRHLKRYQELSPSGYSLELPDFTITVQGVPQ